MNNVATDIAEWLPTLCSIGVEKGAEIALIHDLCKRTVKQLHICGCR